MTKAVFLFNPQSDAATLTGGNWKSGDTSLSNVQNDRYWRVARSASLLPEETQFDIDCRTLKTAHGFAIIVPNATTKCRVRVAAYPDVSYATPTFQTAWTNAGVSGSAWKDEERAPIISTVFAQPVTSRFWRVEIDDPDNLYGHIDVARLFLGEGISPSFNYSYGATLTFKNNVLSSSTLSGSLVHKRRVNPRHWQCNFEYLPDHEAFGDVYDFLRYVGFDREVFILPDSEEKSQLQARSFFGTISQLDPLAQAVIGRSSFGFGVEEKVAHAAVRGDVSLLPYDRLKIVDYPPIIGTGVEVRVPASLVLQRDFTVEIVTGVNVEVPADRLLFSDLAPSLSGGVDLKVPTDLLNISDSAPQVAGGGGGISPTDVVIIRDFAPLIQTGVQILVPVDLLHQTDFAPLLGAGVFINVPDASNQAQQDFAPRVSTGASVAVPCDMVSIRDFAIDPLGGFSPGFDSGFR